jgi:hypothetical protein
MGSGKQEPMVNLFSVKLVKVLGLNFVKLKRNHLTIRTNQAGFEKNRGLFC